MAEERINGRSKSPGDGRIGPTLSNPHHSGELFVAAEPRELRGLLRHCEDVRPLDWPVRWSRGARLHGRQIVLIANGAGPERGAVAVEAARTRMTASAVVSTGYCGALDPSLGVGDIFVATSVESATGRFSAFVPTTPHPYSSGTLASISRVAATRAEKESLRSSGAGAVEMEAAGVAERVREWGKRLFVIRSVSDTADHSFHIDFNRVLEPDGRIGTLRLLGEVVRNPMSALPELYRLYRATRTASITLGDFVVDCRF